MSTVGSGVKTIVTRCVKRVVKSCVMTIVGSWAMRIVSCIIEIVRSKLCHERNTGSFGLGLSVNVEQFSHLTKKGTLS